MTETIINVFLFSSALFQLGVNILFLWVAVARFVHRFRGVTTVDEQLPANLIETRNSPRWLVVLPVLCEAEHLRKSLKCLVSRPECLRDVDIVIAFDGKTQEDVDKCFRVVQETLNIHNNSLAARVHCVPTSRTVCGGQLRRKGEAINLVLSLMGKDCIWARLGSADLLFINDTLKELEEREAELLQKHRDDFHLRVINIPNADYLMVVDVDEDVDSVAFELFRSRVASMPGVTLIQCPKYDSPNGGTISSKAFAANYDSWFYWEAGWLEIDEVVSSPGCSYYGSMAAIAIENVSCEETTIALTSGKNLIGKALFIEGYSIEDYVFYAQKLLNSQTVLLSESIAVGEAPGNLAAWLSLWARWTCDNVTIFLRVTLPALLNGQIVGVTKRLALVYHGASWFSYPNVVFLGLGTICFMANYSGSGAKNLGMLILLVLLLEVGRRLIPTPRTSIVERMVRFFAEVALFPVGALYVLAGIAKGYLNISVPIATSRATLGGRPAWWIILSYLLFISIVLSCSVQIFSDYHAFQKIGALELASLFFASWFVIGLTLVMLDEVVRTLLHGEVKIVKTESEQNDILILSDLRTDSCNVNNDQ